MAAALAERERVADAEARDVLQAGHDVADLARLERLDRNAPWRHEAELLGLEVCAHRHRVERRARRQTAVHDAHERDHAAVLVVRGVEDERARRRVRGAVRRGDPLDDRVEYLIDVEAGLGRDAHDVVRLAAEELDDLRGCAVGVR